MSKNAGYFQLFPAIDVEIESKNKRGRKSQAKTSFARQDYIHHTQQIFPDLFKDLPATASTRAPAASTSTAAAAASTLTARRRYYYSYYYSCDINHFSYCIEHIPLIIKHFFCIY